MFVACHVSSVPALVAPRRRKRRSRYPFGNSCNDIRRQKSVLRRPSSVLCRISNHPRSSSDPPQFNKPRYVGPVGTTNEYNDWNGLVLETEEVRQFADWDTGVMT